MQRGAADIEHQLRMSAIGEPDDDLAEVHVGVKAGEQRDQDHRRRETPQPFAPAPFFSAFLRSRRMAAHDALYDLSNAAFFKVNRYRCTHGTRADAVATALCRRVLPRHRHGDIAPWL